MRGGEGVTLLLTYLLTYLELINYLIINYLIINYLILGGA